jgi:hypothetical protein
MMMKFLEVTGLSILSYQSIAQYLPIQLLVKKTKSCYQSNSYSRRAKPMSLLIVA